MVPLCEKFQLNWNTQATDAVHANCPFGQPFIVLMVEFWQIGGTKSPLGHNSSGHMQNGGLNFLDISKMVDLVFWTYPKMANLCPSRFSIRKSTGLCAREGSCGQTDLNILRRIFGYNMSCGLPFKGECKARTYWGCVFLHAFREYHFSVEISRLVLRRDNISCSQGGSKSRPNIERPYSSPETPRGMSV
jgi:hypothetical protein